MFPSFNHGKEYLPETNTLAYRNLGFRLQRLAKLEEDKRKAEEERKRIEEEFRS